MEDSKTKVAITANTISTIIKWTMDRTEATTGKQVNSSITAKVAKEITAPEQSPKVHSITRIKAKPSQLSLTRFLKPSQFLRLPHLMLWSETLKVTLFMLTLSSTTTTCRDSRLCQFVSPTILTWSSLSGNSSMNSLIESLVRRKHPRSPACSSIFHLTISRATYAISSNFSWRSRRPLSSSTQSRSCSSHPSETFYKQFIKMLYTDHLMTWPEVIHFMPDSFLNLEFHIKNKRF